MQFSNGYIEIHLNWFSPRIFNTRPLKPEEWLLDLWSWDLPLFETHGIVIFGFTVEIVAWK